MIVVILFILSLALLDNFPRATDQSRRPTQRTNERSSWLAASSLVLIYTRRGGGHQDDIVVRCQRVKSERQLFVHLVVFNLNVSASGAPATDASQLRTKNRPTLFRMCLCVLSWPYWRWTLTGAGRMLENREAYLSGLGLTKPLLAWPERSHEREYQPLWGGPAS